MPRIKSETAKHKTLSYEDLPASLKTQVERIIAWRASMGLPDDSIERKERTVKYFSWQRNNHNKE